jgi:hypothetical protein
MIVRQELLGAASGVVLNTLLTGKPESEEDKQAYLNLITHLITAGGLALGIDGATLGSATTSAAMETSNNYLRPQQIKDREKELAGATNLLEQLQIEGKYAALFAAQTSATWTGVQAGLLQAGWSDIQSLAYLLAHPIESLDGMRQLYQELKNHPEACEKYTDEFMRNLESKFNSIDQLIKHGGIKESLQLGQELGGLVWDVGTLVTGVTGVAKGSTKLASLGVKLGKKELDKMAKLTTLAKPSAGLGGKPSVASEVLNIITQNGKPLSSLDHVVTTKPNEAFFWSGKTDGIGGQLVAQDLAINYGGTTLEALLKNNGIHMPIWDPKNPLCVQAWKDISAAYANNVSGTVHAVVGQNLRPGNIWETAELPALINNPKVTQIIIVDPLTGVKTTIFKRGK